jgi:hypothetical protein
MGSEPVALPARIELGFGALVIAVGWRQITVGGSLAWPAVSVSDVTAEQFRELARAFAVAAEVSS